MKTNCLFYAAWRWIRHGGWLLIRRSHAGLYPHFIHADELPEDLPCSQYVAKPGVPCNIVFDGEIKKTIGAIKPAPSGGFDGVLFAFWFLYLAGILSLIAWLIKIFI